MSTVVALHGFTGCAEDFAELRPHLRDGTRLTAPDFPGHGRLRALRNAEDYSLQSHLDRITDAAGDAPKITLLGYSMGGRLALHWALAHPDRLAQLILVGASPGLATSAEREERKLADAALAKHIRAQGLPGFFKYWHNQPFFHSLFKLPSSRLEPILRRRQQNDPEGLALSLEHVGTGALPSLWDRLGELRCPVDLVAGAEDPKFIRIAHRMGELIPRARVSIVEQAGHAVHLEQPADLAMLVR